MSWTEIKKSAEDGAEFVLAEAANITVNYPKRAAGSEGEKQVREHLASLLSQCADDVRAESFSFAPDAATGWIYLTVVCALLAFVAYFFVAFVSVVLIILALVPFVLQGVLCLRSLDGMYKTSVSENLVATAKCKGEVKRRIYLCAHVDAAPEFRLHAKLGGKFFAAAMAGSVVGVLYMLAANIARWVWLGSMGAALAADAYLIVGLVGLIFIPFWVSCFFFVDKRKTVDGANDDLSGCLTAVAVLKAMRESGMVCENTEVGVLLTSAEECGLRGAYAWCDAHAADDKDVPALYLVLDTLRESDKLAVTSRELNGLQKTDAEEAAAFAEAAQAVGVNCKKYACMFGATDAAAFARRGARAFSVTALGGLPEYYHTDKDTADNMNAPLIADCIKAVAEFIRRADNAED